MRSVLGVLTRLKLFRASRESQTASTGFEGVNLPDISGTPAYSIEELTELRTLTEMFNKSRQVSAKWSAEIGRLEFTSDEGTKFWFMSSNEECEHLASLVAFNNPTFRASLQNDGRVSLTGWCEIWYYGTITTALIVVNKD